MKNILFVATLLLAAETFNSMINVLQILNGKVVRVYIKGERHLDGEQPDVDLAPFSITRF